MTFIDVVKPSFLKASLFLCFHDCYVQASLTNLNSWWRLLKISVFQSVLNRFRSYTSAEDLFAQPRFQGRESRTREDPGSEVAFRIQLRRTGLRLNCLPRG